MTTDLRCAELTFKTELFAQMMRVLGSAEMIYEKARELENLAHGTPVEGQCLVNAFLTESTYKHERDTAEMFLRDGGVVTPMLVICGKKSFQLTLSARANVFLLMMYLQHLTKVDFSRQRLYAVTRNGVAFQIRVNQDLMLGDACNLSDTVAIRVEENLN